MKERQILTRLEIPIALPVIATGVRSAAVQVIGTDCPTVNATQVGPVRLNVAPGSAWIVIACVMRAYVGAPFEKIADAVAIPAYSDRTAEHGKSYRYEVTAVSRTGHESPRSEMVEITLP